MQQGRTIDSAVAAALASQCWTVVGIDRGGDGKTLRGERSVGAEEFQPEINNLKAALVPFFFFSFESHGKNAKYALSLGFLHHLRVLERSFLFFSPN